jgi:hypothetical protein
MKKWIVGRIKRELQYSKVQTIRWNAPGRPSVSKCCTPPARRNMDIMTRFIGIILTAFYFGKVEYAAEPLDGVDAAIRRVDSYKIMCFALAICGSIGK